MDTNGHIILSEDYVSFEIAKLLKEKGFDEKCRASYNKDGNFLLHKNYYFQLECGDGYLGPTLQMACKWLREKDIHICPKYCCFCGSKKNDKPYYKWEDRVLKLPSGNQVHPQIYGIHEYYETYEEAVEAACLYVLKNLI